MKLCECDCGGVAPFAKKTDKRCGHVKGKQIRFIHGHHAKFTKRIYLYGNLNPNWKGGKAKIVCAKCGKEFLRRRLDVESRKNNFCSRKCAGLWKRKDGGNPKFKSVSKIIVCDQCGKLFERWPCRIKNRKHHFCSQECTALWQSINWCGKNAHGWRGGLANGEYCPTWTDKEFKEYILERDEYKCQNPDCWGKAKILNIHHINYIKKDCSINNLITLCVSCNGRANKKREWHMMYYQAIMLKRKQLLGVCSCR